MTGRNASSPEPTAKEKRRSRFWGIVGLVIVPAILLGAMLSGEESMGLIHIVAVKPDTLGDHYITVAQCNDFTTANTALLMESMLDSANLAEFKRRYPREDALAQRLNEQLKRR